MTTLALDLGTHTGWALRCPEGLYTGQENHSLLRGDSPGMRFLRFRAMLKGLEVLGKPELVVYEQPHLRGGAAASVLAGMEAETLAYCAERGIQHTAVHTSTLKKWATGSGAANKEKMIRCLRERLPDHPPPTSDDEADATLLLLYAEEVLLRC